MALWQQTVLWPMGEPTAGFAGLAVHLDPLRVWLLSSSSFLCDKRSSSILSTLACFD